MIGAKLPEPAQVIVNFNYANTIHTRTIRKLTPGFFSPFQGHPLG